MTYSVQLTETAREQLLEIDAWWTLERPAAPDLVEHELEAAVMRLANQPTVGRRYGAATSASYRRLLLRRTELHVYYLVDEPASTVLIVAIWPARRGHGPPLP